MRKAIRDVVIIGGGPAGLSAAIALRGEGIADVTVIEREREAGGIPRHCGHPPFGIREFRRLMSGPAYARRLVEEAERSGASLLTSHTFTGSRIEDDLIVLSVATPNGMTEIAARRLLIATGTRETTRAARLISGERPLGVFNTGALQAYAYVEHRRPFERPVIIGSELVALSAILTCRSLGAQPVAMIEEGPRPTAPLPFFAFPKLLGIPILTATKLIDIIGRPKVEAVRIKDRHGNEREIPCDGVILTGQFTPEAQAARLLAVDIDPATGGPEIDQFGRTSNPAIFAAGNVLHPVETAGWCFREGRAIARFMARDLKTGLPAPSAALPLTANGALRYVVPQRIVPGEPGIGHLQMRVKAAASGTLSISQSGSIRAAQSISRLPERRLTLSMPDISTDGGDVVVTL